MTQETQVAEENTPSRGKRLRQVAHFVAKTWNNPIVLKELRGRLPHLERHRIQRSEFKERRSVALGELRQLAA